MAASDVEFAGGVGSVSTVLVVDAARDIEVEDTEVVEVTVEDDVELPAGRVEFAGKVGSPRTVLVEDIAREDVEEETELVDVIMADDVEVTVADDVELPAGRVEFAGKVGSPSTVLVEDTATDD